MMAAGHDDVTEMLNVLLEAENVSEMSDDEATSWSGEYTADAGLQTGGTNESSLLAASELLDRDLFVRMTSGPYSKFSFSCTRLAVSLHCVFVESILNTTEVFEQLLTLFETVANYEFLSRNSSDTVPLFSVFQ